MNDSQELSERTWEHLFKEWNLRKGPKPPRHPVPNHDWNLHPEKFEFNPEAPDDY